MNLNEFLTHPDVQLPLRWDSYSDYETFVTERLTTFMRLVEEIDSSAVADAIRLRKDSMSRACTNLLQSLRLFSEGHPHEAYVPFDETMKALTNEIEKHAFETKLINDLGILYRVRRSQTPFLKRNDLFHIPFEMRHIVTTQRYSIPGLPCLYLGGSLYTCWEEMGRPPLHELQCSAFWAKSGKTLKLLNLSNSPARLALYAPLGASPFEPDLLTTNIVLWPLLAMSSVAVKHSSGAFKPEYVIPQMVLQWVSKNHGFDGVVYFSTHVRSVSKRSPLPICNVVLPAKQVAAKGRCSHLCESFKMTDPVGWQLLSSINVGQGISGRTIPSFPLEFLEGIEEQYENTEFGMVQTRLNKIVEHIMLRNKNGEPSIGDVFAD